MAVLAGWRDDRETADPMSKRERLRRFNLEKRRFKEGMLLLDSHCGVYRTTCPHQAGYRHPAYPPPETSRGPRGLRRVSLKTWERLYRLRREGVREFRMDDTLQGAKILRCARLHG